jgi:predicted RNase H-like HicB family nuclease
MNYWGKKMYKYAIEIFYSDEDEGYIAVVPELADCSAF